MGKEYLFTDFLPNAFLIAVLYLAFGSRTEVKKWIVICGGATGITLLVLSAMGLI